MKKFLDKDFLLTTESAKKLYFDYAKNLPIIDYHSHVSAKEIYENKPLQNIYQAWLTGDHYKWRLMRADGVAEEYITGSAPAREKFQKFAEVLPKAIGNPMFHWCHLELKEYFGFDGVLNEETANAVWDIAEQKALTPRQIIAQSKVELIGTTDDPADTLEWHKKLSKDKSFCANVIPTFRPDKALNIEKAGWGEYIKILSAVSGVEINSLEDLKTALSKRIDFFKECGCKASDHGLDYMVFAPCSEADADKIMKSALKGKEASVADAEKFKTHLLLFCAKEYTRVDFVMQLHFNCLRNPNSKMFKELGADSGFDCIGPHPSKDALSGLLNALYETDTLPKTILYSLDGQDNAFIDSLMGAFQGEGVCGKIQHGSAWWFNDTKKGMTEQITSLASLGILSNFVGMLTDSRSFLSYTRHDYFRRILCDIIGTWIEKGEYPEGGFAGKIVSDICYYNAKKYFSLEDR